AKLDITERRVPQDGRIQVRHRDNLVDHRVSSLPAQHGEKITLRILDTKRGLKALDTVGLSPVDLKRVRVAITRPEGMVLVTGPTGSGKSTTLYTMIRELNTPDVNIMTAEDPVEYELSGITQVPVRANIGVTFETVLRSFLRQDPDIMLVGEIRDIETAEIAVKAAITGHVVLSTLHTNSAPASIGRLSHMGLARYLIADSVKLVVAQRLVRRICPSCRQAAPTQDDLVRLVGEGTRERLARACAGRGCPECQNTGYNGRIPLFEIMEVRSPQMRELILSGAGADAIGKRAGEEGMRTLSEAALDAVAAGHTTVKEALDILLSD
ncbi:MAG: type II/IV secretion system protein, partial [Elusimicrobia bacterium]|nr:type II/IV secretion system protein [Elusimicrobiota bacterium]